MSTLVRTARRRIVATLAVGALVCATAGPAGARVPAARDSAAASQSTASAGPGAVSRPATTYAPGRYVVVLTKPPVASYTGGTEHIPATKPRAGQKVQVAAPAARQYAAVLDADQRRVAASVGVRRQQTYSVSLNGFSATLTSAQALKLARTPGVLTVAKDTLRYATDDKVDYDYLKLAGSNGLWAALGGVGRAGKGVVIGVIDSGFYPESKSFAGARLGTAFDPANPYRAYHSGSQIVMHKANGQLFTGECQTGEDFTANLCNSKVISARYFDDTFMAAAPGNFADYASPRDADGHGSHTASTAAGYGNVAASVDGIEFGKISGVAPAASIAVYKALFLNTAGNAVGYSSDLLAAVDQSVADGVDVINYSIGNSDGSESAPVDPVQLAFLSAASAGIFVAASAGNGGPGPSTADNTSPWVTTVAASTLKPYQGTVVLGNGQKYAGVSVTVRAPVGPKPLVTGVAVKLASASAADAALCQSGTLDPAKTAGKIVECDRGVNPRVAKSAEVKAAGGAGMVLVNLAPSDTDADVHTVPTVHLDAVGGLVVRAYAATAGATATLVPGNTSSVQTPYPQVAGFSSRGPSLASNGDILKPDIAAPGVGILAAVSPENNNGRHYDFYSGTSMAAPHIAGLAALYAAVHPTWSPMAIKSALMTTATDTKNIDGTPATDPFAQGAGEVNPSAMFNPALVYDAGDTDWLSYLEGLGINTGTGAPAVPGSDYNQASIAAGAVVSSVTVTRRVTAVTPGVYHAVVNVPGFTATVRPSILVLEQVGQVAQFTVTLTRTTATFGQYATGFLTWTGAGTTVRSPIAVRPLAVRSPARVAFDATTSGSATWSVTSGLTGAFPITPFGLTAGRSQVSSVTATTSKQFTVTVAAGTKVARFATHVANDNGAQDIDLTVYQVTNGVRTQVGVDADPLADEAVDLLNPVPGTYVAVVAGYLDAPGTTSTPFAFRDFEVGTSPDTGTFTVSPSNSTVTAGQTLSVTASAGGLTPNTAYLGWVQYVDGSGTLVTVNPAA